MLALLHHAIFKRVLEFVELPRPFRGEEGILGRHPQFFFMVGAIVCPLVHFGVFCVSGAEGVGVRGGGDVDDLLERGDTARGEIVDIFYQLVLLDLDRQVGGPGEVQLGLAEVFFKE